MSNSKLVPIAVVLAMTSVLAVKYVHNGRSRRAQRPSSSKAVTNRTLPIPTSGASVPKHLSYGPTTVLRDAAIDEVHVLDVPRLSVGAGGCANDASHYNKLVGENNIILKSIVRDDGDSHQILAFKRGGPRADLHFCGKDVRAAVITCGGLCPGLNNVIREVVNSLWHLYGVRNILGIRNGLSGFYSDSVMDLNPEVVEPIHHQGGTVLGTCRGSFDLDRIMDFIQRRGINQLYIVGGDGTHRAADKISQRAAADGVELAVAGIPKTIDNDVDLIDRSFGFNTAVEAGLDAIRAAKVEASCAPGGIGVVKLMGRHSGFIASHATLSSGDVNLCLVPEAPVVLRGEDGILPHLERVLKEKGHAVVVVAEGAGEDLMGGKNLRTDASGNVRLKNIGGFITDAIKEYFKEIEFGEVNVKYIDPSYMIRSIPANAADSLYCMMLGQNAVHGAMAGFTGFTVGLVNNRVVFLPIAALVANSPRFMRTHGRTWERVLNITGQPNALKK